MDPKITTTQEGNTLPSHIKMRTIKTLYQLKSLQAI